MIADNEKFFREHPDPEVRRRGGFLIKVMVRLRNEIEKDRLRLLGYNRRAPRPSRTAAVPAAAG
jgi:hypothetical protein